MWKLSITMPAVSETAFADGYQLGTVPTIPQDNANDCLWLLRHCLEEPASTKRSLEKYNILKYCLI